MPARKLKEYLDSHAIKYETRMHYPMYTAQEIAASAHIPGKELAKTVIVKIDDRIAMAVLPASHKIDFNLLTKAAEAKKVQLATEQEFQALFPDCEVGAMPPFGNLYGIDVIVADQLTEDPEIAFSAGTHEELVIVAYKDFEKLVKPRVAKFSAPS
ncbi:MAG: aminoacyl-tRNA deacylase [bacterium]